MKIIYRKITTSGFAKDDIFFIILKIFRLATTRHYQRVKLYFGIYAEIYTEISGEMNILSYKKGGY